MPVVFDAFPVAVVIGVVVAFFVAGSIKGVVGLGLPTVSLGLMTIFLDLRIAVALLLAPLFVTNFMQAVAGGNGRALWRRLWLFFIIAAATVPLGAFVLLRVNVILLSGVLGALLFTYAAFNLTIASISVSPARERAVGVVCGVCNGIFTGMTGSSIVPGVMYLQSVGLSRDALVQAMGILFVTSAVTLALALQYGGLLTANLGLASVAAIVPAVIGMMLGARVRRRIAEARFRRVFFIAVLVLGLVIMIKAGVTLFNKGYSQ